jgi:hypothetical protein
VINVVQQQRSTAQHTLRRVRVPAFWVVLGIEGLVIVAVLALVLSALVPAQAPAASSEEREIVRAAILDRLAGYETDPPFEVLPGITAPVSNVAGFTLHGQIYYYYVEGQQNYDPLSRGKLTRDEVEIILRDTSGPSPFVVYQQLP